MVAVPISQIRELRSSLAAFGATFEPELLFASDCKVVMDEAARIEKIAAVVVSMAAARVAETYLITRGGESSPAAAIAKATGQSIGAAKERMATAERLKHLPKTADAARKGDLSKEQAAAIADAASANPAAEADLLDLAGQASLNELRDECQKVKANADPDPDATHRRIHRDRNFRTWTDSQGAFRMAAAATTKEGAELLAAHKPFFEAIFTRARSAGTREPMEAYAWDALLELARTAHAKRAAASNAPAQPDVHGPITSADPPAPGDVHAPTTSAGPPATVITRIDYETLLRGHTIDGETCDVAGVGPIPPSAVQDILATNPFLAAVLTKGEQVLGVAHLGRAANAKQRTALAWLQDRCLRLGCPKPPREYDHGDPFATCRQTELGNLRGLCDHDHDLKTHHGWDLVPGTGRRPMVPPHDPRHPKHCEQADDPPPAPSDR